jgi:hypothetical protein
MNKTSWHVLLGFGAAVAVATACTVSSGGGADDDDQTTTRGGPTGSGGSGGSGGDDSTTTTTTTSATTGAGGAAGETGETTSAGGTGGTGGSGGGEIECLEEDDPTGEPAPTENLDQDPDANSCCVLCAAENCAAGMAACYAIDPENICGVANGEMQVIQECMIDNDALPGLDPGDSDLEECFGAAVEEASSVLCFGGTVSGATNDLATCLHGDNDGVGGCFDECYTDFDDGECTYRD